MRKIKRNGLNHRVVMNMANKKLIEIRNFNLAVRAIESMKYGTPRTSNAMDYFYNEPCVDRLNKACSWVDRCPWYRFTIDDWIQVAYGIPSIKLTLKDLKRIKQCFTTSMSHI